MGPTTAFSSPAPSLPGTPQSNAFAPATPLPKMSINAAQAASHIARRVQGCVRLAVFNAAQVRNLDASIGLIAACFSVLRFRLSDRR